MRLAILFFFLAFLASSPSQARSCQACMNACAEGGGGPGDCFFQCVGEGSCKSDLTSLIGSLPAPVAQRQCRAILVPDSAIDSLCVDMHSALDALSVADWNRNVCGSSIGFRAGEFDFRRDQGSHGLEANWGSILCVWEVRANSAR